MCAALNLMSWDAVTALAAVIGVVAVVYQLGLVRKQMYLQNYADYTKRYQELVLNFPEDVNESSFVLKKIEGDKRDRTMRYMRTYFDLCFEEWDLHRRRFIDDATWTVWEGGIKTALSKPAFQQAWVIIKNSRTEYGAPFEAFVEANMNSRRG